jgi:hypothetical protein
MHWLVGNVMYRLVKEICYNIIFYKLDFFIVINNGISLYGYYVKKNYMWNA